MTMMMANNNSQQRINEALFNKIRICKQVSVYNARINSAGMVVPNEALYNLCMRRSINTDTISDDNISTESQQNRPKMTTCPCD